MATAEASAAALNEILAEVRGVGSMCTVAPFLAALAPDRADAVRAAVERNVPAEAIGRAVCKWGFNGTPVTVARHLRRRCQCQH